MIVENFTVDDTQGLDWASNSKSLYNEKPKVLLTLVQWQISKWPASEPCGTTQPCASTVAASMTADVISIFVVVWLRSFTLFSRIGNGNGMCVLNSWMVSFVAAAELENSGIPWMYPRLRNAFFTLPLPSAPRFVSFKNSSRPKVSSSLSS